jgi:hypothetical protein
MDHKRDENTSKQLKTGWKTGSISKLEDKWTQQ